MKKVILISIDGTRADAIEKCGSPFVEYLKKNGTYCLNEKTVFPSVTLPCHYSMTHSVPPERHGMTVNFYMPPVRPVAGIFEVVNGFGGKVAMCSNFVFLRDLASPEAVHVAYFLKMAYYEEEDHMVCEKALEFLKTETPDIAFVHMVDTDHYGHDHGFMSDKYLERLNIALELAKKIYESAKDEYTVIITSDHGGHDRIHGTDLKEDMFVPFFMIGDGVKKNNQIEEMSILDVTPTIANVMGVSPIPLWEGKVIDYKE
jgi:predicted AlkP superfamily pyrophosphatase or phosphodiesterase